MILNKDTPVLQKSEQGYHKISNSHDVLAYSPAKIGTSFKLFAPGGLLRTITKYPDLLLVIIHMLL